MPIRVLVLFSAVFFGSGLPDVFAQQSIDLASISGRVTDQTGAVLPHAEVTARHALTNVVTSVVSDDGGRFRLAYLRVGPYDVVVRLPGFREVTQRLNLTAGAAFDLPVTLTLDGVDSSVTVTADAAALETARSQIASTVTESEVRTLPMNGRNFLELALLVPGVSPTNVASTQLFPETSAVPGVTLSVGSQRNLSNNFIVDGLSANDDAAGLSGIAYSVDAIEQVQVVTSGGQAELGRALGGYLNVITKSGTNARRGTVYGFFRDDHLNAHNPLLRAKLPMQQLQVGGSTGGPIVANRTFYFANVEHRDLDQSGLVTIAPAAATSINSHLAGVGYAGPRVETGLYNNPFDTTNLLGKVDHQVSGRNQVSIRYSLYDVKASNSRGAGGLSASSASSGLDSRDQAAALSNTFMLSSRAVLETRAQIAHSDLEAPATDPIGPAVSIAGVATFGSSTTSPTRRVNSLYQVANSLSVHAGDHALRVGIDLLYNVSEITFPRAQRGSYIFSSLENFLAGIYNNAGFTQTFGETQVAQDNPNVAVFVQDEWKLASGLTANLGVRYDLQFLETIDTDANNISPRVGVAWSPFGSPRTVIRAGVGLFYDRVPLRALANALLSARNTTDVTKLRQTSVSLSPTQAGAPVFPATLSAAVPAVTLPNLTTMDRQLQNAYSRQANVEWEHQLGSRTTIAAAYHYLRGEDLLMSINQNVPACAASGSNNGCRPNSMHANNNQYSSAGRSNYHGLHLSLTQRPAGWGYYRVSYTLSKSMNNVGEFFFSSPIDPLDLSKDWGRSDDDQRHRLVLSGAVQTSNQPATTLRQRLTNGFQVSATLQAYSALPLNVTSGITTVQGTLGRPVVNGEFIPRNAAFGSGFLSLNVRVTRVFDVRGLKVEGAVEAFNLTDHVNVVTRNGNFGSGAYPTDPSPTFGQVTSVGEPRAVQFGVRVRF